MTARLYTRGLQKLFVRNYGSVLPNGNTLVGELNGSGVQVVPGDPLPDELFVDLLDDDICMALVNVNEPDDADGGAYVANLYVHEYLSDVVGVQIGGSTPNPNVWTGSSIGQYSHVTKHSAPVGGKKLIYTAAVGAGTGSIPEIYNEVMFDCDDVTFVAVPDLAPKSEAIVLYKRVLTVSAPSGSTDPADIDPQKSPLIAYFDGASVALDPNGNDVEVVISNSGLMRWGVGH